MNNRLFADFVKEWTVGHAQVIDGVEDITVIKLNKDTVVHMSQYELVAYHLPTNAIIARTNDLKGTSYIEKRTAIMHFVKKILVFKG